MYQAFYTLSTPQKQISLHSTTEHHSKETTRYSGNSKLNAASYCHKLKLHITRQRFFQPLVKIIIMTLELQIKL